MTNEKNELAEQLRRKEQIIKNVKEDNTRYLKENEILKTECDELAQIINELKEETSSNKRLSSEFNI